MKNKKFQTFLMEVVLGSAMVTGFGWHYAKNFFLVLILQYVVIRLGDKWFRPTLVHSKRKRAWNGAIWTLKITTFILFQIHQYFFGVQLLLVSAVLTRIMFCKDQDRTIATVNELKEAYFLPTIIKVAKEIDGFLAEVQYRAKYVLSE